MHFITSYTNPNESSSSSMARTKMDDKELIIASTLSYLFVSFLIHLCFFINIIFNHQWHILNLCRHICQRCWRVRRVKKEQTEHEIPLDNNRIPRDFLVLPTMNSFANEQLLSISSSISSNLNFDESETILNRTVRSFGFFFCICLFVTNGARLALLLLPKFDHETMQLSSTMCLLQSFFLHVFALFHLNLTITIRLFWHYCFIFSKYWQTATFRRLIYYICSLFICLCLFTWPSFSNEWGSITIDSFLNLCIVNYSFRWSYTFFILSCTCFIPFVLLIVSHHRQMISIDRRIEKSLWQFIIENDEQKSDLIRRKKRFEYSSYSIIIWSIVNFILILGIHFPHTNETVKSIFYYTQLSAFLVDPILYMFIFRSLSIITLLRPTEEHDF